MSGGWLHVAVHSDDCQTPFGAFSRTPPPPRQGLRLSLGTAAHPYALLTALTRYISVKSLTFAHRVTPVAVEGPTAAS